MQAQILNVLLDLQRRVGIALLFITHDLAVVERIADQVGVMFQGRIVETGVTERVLDQAEHPYTRRLLTAARGSRG